MFSRAHINWWWNLAPLTTSYHHPLVACQARCSNLLHLCSFLSQLWCINFSAVHCLSTMWRASFPKALALAKKHLGKRAQLTRLHKCQQLLGLYINPRIHQSHSLHLPNPTLHTKIMQRLHSSSWESKAFHGFPPSPLSKSQQALKHHEHRCQGSPHAWDQYLFPEQPTHLISIKAPSSPNTNQHPQFPCARPPKALARGRIQWQPF